MIKIEKKRNFEDLLYLGIDDENDHEVVIVKYDPVHQPYFKIRVGPWKASSGLESDWASFIYRFGAKFLLNMNVKISAFFIHFISKLSKINFIISSYNLCFPGFTVRDFSNLGLNAYMQ